MILFLPVTGSKKIKEMKKENEFVDSFVFKVFVTPVCMFTCVFIRCEASFFCIYILYLRLIYKFFFW